MICNLEEDVLSEVLAPILSVQNHDKKVFVLAIQ